MTVIQSLKLRNNWRQYSLRLALLLGIAVSGLVVGSVSSHADEIAPSSRQGGEPPRPVPDDWPNPPI